MYLLLRDNKESGPYSFDELKAKGLKAYDLVWIENKSAAWRYPCEIEELSSFAPPVEEQPFDRFYKKPSPDNAAVAASYQPQQATPSEESAPRVALPVSGSGSGSSPYSGEPSAVSGKRIIYVTLPAGKNIPARETFSRESSPREIKETVPSPSVLPERRAAAYAPSDSLGQAAEDWATGDASMPRTGNSYSRANILQSAAVILCVLALLAAGIFIGLSISSNKDSLGFTQKITAQRNPVSNPVSQLPPPPVNPAVSAAPPSASADPARQVLTPVKDSTSTAAAVVTETAVAANPTPKKILANSKEKSLASAQKTQPAPASSTKDSAMIGLPVVHREASRRTDLSTDKIDKDVIRNNLSNLVSVGTNSYSVGTFGGITGVQLTVSNKSVYPLDLVVVEVQYVQANKKVFKTENLYFRSIGPGSALMQEAPNSTRGIKVQYRITLVNSKELGLSYSTL